MPDLEVVFSLHAISRLQSRGATQEEIRQVLEKGQEAGAQKGRRAKEALFEFNGTWRGQFYEQKKVKVIYVLEADRIVIVTVKTYYGKWR